MDVLFAQILADLQSSDALRQSSALLQALQQSAAGRDISIIAKSAVNEIVASPASAISKKLAFDVIRSTRLTPDLWDTLCTGVRNDLDFPDPEVAAAAVSNLVHIPSYRLSSLINDCHKEISACFTSVSDNLRFTITETLGCILARDDLVALCENNVKLLDRFSNWWALIAKNMLDKSDAVSKVAFESIGRLFQEFEFKKMSRLARDKLIDTENSVAIRSNWILFMIYFVWMKRNALISRSLVLPIESFRATIFPLVYVVKSVATGSVDVIKKLSSTSMDGKTSIFRYPGNEESSVGVSDVVSHLAPFLVSSLDPALIFEVGINMLYLADVPGGKPEWASASVIAILTLWDRQEYSSGRESIVRAVVTNLHLLDLSMQVSLFKKLLHMVRNLRAESDRMHALACICRTALCVHLFTKESVRRGQKPVPGTDIVSLFEDAKIKEYLNNATSKNLFREELVAMLVESCFQLSLPLPEQKNSGMESRVIGALAYGTGYGALNWTEPALEVVEVCRPCVKWDCEGRTYAIDCYLKLLVRLCNIYDTRGGVKRVKDGASQDQILNETRLQNVQRELVKDLLQINTPRITARLLWAVTEHINFDGLDPLLADDPDDPLNIIVANIRKVLFNLDSSSTTTNRLQDVQAALLCAQSLGSRNARAGQLLIKELEEFKSSPAADSVNKHQCRLILQRIKYASTHPDDKWAGVNEARGDYPFSHHKLTVQFYDASAALDRKLEGLVHRAISELWKPQPNELTRLLAKEVDSSLIKVPPVAFTLTGSSDPCYIEGYHLTDPGDGRITLHLKILNLLDIDLDRVYIRVGLSSGLYFMDGSPQAVRQLFNLTSQEPVPCSVTVGVSHFERCTLSVQVMYHPFRGCIPEDPEGDYPEEDPQRQKKSLKAEEGQSNGGGGVLNGKEQHPKSNVINTTEKSDAFEKEKFDKKDKKIESDEEECEANFLAKRQEPQQEAASEEGDDDDGVAGDDAGTMNGDASGFVSTENQNVSNPPKTFVASEIHDGKSVNIAEGLKLYDDLCDDSETSKLITLVKDLRASGKKGELQGQAFVISRRPMKGHGRVMIQLGTPTAADEENLSDIKTEPIPESLQDVIERLLAKEIVGIKPDSCIIDIFDEGDHSQPHSWPHWFGRPVCVLFLTDCEMVFGKTLTADHPGDYRGALKLSLHPGDLLLVEGKSADFAKHAIPSVQKQRILVTLTKSLPKKVVNSGGGYPHHHPSNWSPPPSRSPSHHAHRPPSRVLPNCPRLPSPNGIFVPGPPIAPGMGFPTTTATTTTALTMRHPPPTRLPLSGTGVFLPPQSTGSSSSPSKHNDDHDDDGGGESEKEASCAENHQDSGKSV